MNADEIVFVVDDDLSVLDSLTVLLETAGYRVVAYNSAKEFLSEPVGDNGCLILDLNMPEMNGLELQACLARSERILPVILVTGFAEVGTAVESMKLGAYDVLEKPYDDEQLLSVIADAMAKGRKERQKASVQRQAASRLSGLSERERQVLDLVVEGSASKVIAHELGISRRTVEIHRAKIMRKAEVQNTAELVRLAKESAAS
ncbi:response regulator transcription factor [Pseudohoeflea suaedae]|nr:response regulator [Pseudohoeflea suaedae]